MSRATKTTFDTNCRVRPGPQYDAVDGRVIVGPGSLVFATDTRGETVPVERVFDVSITHERAGHRVTVGHESPDGRKTVSVFADEETAHEVGAAVFAAVIDDTWATIYIGAQSADGEQRSQSGRLRVREDRLEVACDDTVLALQNVERVRTADREERLRVRVSHDGRSRVYELSLPSPRLRNVVGRYLRTVCGSPDAAASTAGIRVLLVDDDVGFAELAAEFLSLEHDEIELEVATSPDEGFERLSQSPAIDCIVSDYRMPGTTGLAFLKRVREVDPDVPFLLFTGRGDETVAAEAIQAGVTDYVRKEATSAQFTFLVDRIREAVEDEPR